MERTVRELLGVAQQAYNAKLDCGRVDTVFKVGDLVLLQSKKLLDAADIGKPSHEWSTLFLFLALLQSRSDRDRRARTWWSCCSTNEILGVPRYLMR